MFSLPSPPTPPPLNNPLPTMPCLCSLFSSLFSLFFFLFFHVQTWNPEFRVPSSKFEDGTSKFGFNVQCPLPPNATTRPPHTMLCLISFLPFFHLFFFVFSSFSKFKLGTQTSKFHPQSSNFELGTQSSNFHIRRSKMELRGLGSTFNVPSLPTHATHPPPTMMPCLCFSFFLVLLSFFCFFKFKLGTESSKFHLRSSKITWKTWNGSIICGGLDPVLCGPSPQHTNNPRMPPMSLGLEVKMFSGCVDIRVSQKRSQTWRDEKWPKVTWSWIKEERLGYNFDQK